MNFKKPTISFVKAGKISVQLDDEYYENGKMAKIFSGKGVGEGRQAFASPDFFVQNSMINNFYLKHFWI